MMKDVIIHLFHSSDVQDPTFDVYLGQLERARFGNAQTRAGRSKARAAGFMAAVPGGFTIIYRNQCFTSYLTTAACSEISRFNQPASFGVRFKKTLAGTPRATAYSGTSMVTNEFAPIVAIFPMVTPGRIVAFAPIYASSPIFTLSLL